MQTIDEGINELECLLARLASINNPKCCEAIQLGIEALIYFKDERLYSTNIIKPRLPGETKE